MKKDIKLEYRPEETDLPSYGRDVRDQGGGRMTSLPAYHNSGLATAREMPGAVLTAGLKNPSGYGFVKGSTGRFWIGMPTGADSKTARKSHPDFAAFNRRGAMPEVGGSHPAQTMRCLLRHVDIDDAFKISRSCYRGPPNDPRVTNPPTIGPWCIGDGHDATRWDGSKYQAITCPDDLCPYAQELKDAKGRPWKPCKVKLTVLFCPRWEGTQWGDAGMPQILLRYSSQGRRMRDSFLGMIEGAQKTASGFGVEITNWFGLPYMMTLEKRRTSKGLSTDVAFTLDGDLLAWLATVRATTHSLAAPLPVSLLDPACNTPEALADEEIDLTAGLVTVKPASIVTGPTVPSESRREIDA